MYTAEAISLPDRTVLPLSAQVHVARQPIFDRSTNLFAYELLYRHGNADAACFDNGEQATAAVVTASFLDIGLQKVVGESPAFINATYEFLVSRAALALPPDKVVLEILEDVIVDEALVGAVVEYVAAGYRIALDDFEYDPSWAPLLRLAHIVKIDVMAMDMDSICEHIALLAEFEVELLAEKIETDDEFQALHALGFDYFQGYFFAKPSVVSGMRVPANKLATLNLLAKIQNPEADIDEIADLVALDPALSYRLMKFMNSAFLSLPETVSTIQRGVMYLGLAAVKRWVTLVVLASVADKPSELTCTALTRARMTELLCTRTLQCNPVTGFTIGLFSALDAFMDRPLSDLLVELPLSPTVISALLEGDGIEGEALQCTLAYEKGEWSHVESHSCGIASEELADIYVQAVQWADRATAVTHA
ncbi:MAG: EAL and modified HD-GYP domain-containing signal transduction protein [Gammaproteobacteria bacterium]|jgi:EAL and modified HD-GYP domain-containing signal transduction protein